MAVMNWLKKWYFNEIILSLLIVAKLSPASPVWHHHHATDSLVSTNCARKRPVYPHSLLRVSLLSPTTGFSRHEKNDTISAMGKGKPPKKGKKQAQLEDTSWAWLHLASWNLSDSQFCSESKTEPKCSRHRTKFGGGDTAQKKCIHIFWTGYQ